MWTRIRLSNKYINYKPITNSDYMLFVDYMAKLGEDVKPYSWRKSDYFRNNPQDSVIGVDPNNMIDFCSWLGDKYELGYKYFVPSWDDLKNLENNSSVYYLVDGVFFVEESSLSILSSTILLDFLKDNYLRLKPFFDSVFGYSIYSEYMVLVQEKIADNKSWFGVSLSERDLNDLANLDPTLFYPSFNPEKDNTLFWIGFIESCFFENDIEVINKRLHKLYEIYKKRKYEDEYFHDYFKLIEGFYNKTSDEVFVIYHKYIIGLIDRYSLFKDKDVDIERTLLNIKFYLELMVGYKNALSTVYFIIGRSSI